MTTSLAIRPPVGMMDPVVFDHMQRVGKVLALSPLFPEHLRKPDINTAVANAVLCLNMATRLNEDVLTVAQNIFFVNGRPGWNATYMIAKANDSGKFSEEIDWIIEGKGMELSVTAFAVLARSGKRVESTLTMEIAKAEGWTKNSKYQTIPQQMLSYRSAVFLIRLYCPEVMIGVPSIVELEDDPSNARDVTPREPEPASLNVFGEPKAEPEPAPAVKPPATPRSRAKAPAAPAPEPAPVTVAEVVDEETGEVTEAENSAGVAELSEDDPAHPAFLAKAQADKAAADEAAKAEAAAKAKAVEVRDRKPPAPKVEAQPGFALDPAPAAKTVETNVDLIKVAIREAETADEVNKVWTDSKAALDQIKTERPDLFNDLAQLADDRAESLTVARGG
jgi:hypothetical protein